MRAIPNDWEMPASLRDRLTPSGGRQQALFAEGFLVLHLHRLPDPDKPEREGVLFFRPPDGRWRDDRGECDLSLLSRMLDAYETKVEALEDRLDSSCRLRDYYEVLSAGHPISRALVNLTAALDRAYEVVTDRRILPHVERAHVILRGAELLMTDAKMAMDYAMAQDSEVQARANLEMARGAHRLNLMVALFLPLTALTSLFGMNLASGIEFAGPLAFWSVLIVGIGLGYLLRIFIKRAQLPMFETLKAQSDRLGHLLRIGNSHSQDSREHREN